jgi:tRNA dimethylallyltransferase
MLEAGALDEARAVLALGLPPAAPALKAVGARELFAQLRGELAHEDAAAAAKQATRNFAKRQGTWFRNRTPDWPQIDPRDSDAAAALLARVLQARTSSR